jgi:hypothetical protein
MQTVVQDDTVMVYWVAQAADENGNPVGPPMDLTATTVTVWVIPADPADGTTAASIPGEVVGDPLDGRFRHSVAALDPVPYLLQAEFDGPPGQETGPTFADQLLIVRPKIGAS